MGAKISFPNLLNFNICSFTFSDSPIFIFSNAQLVINFKTAILKKYIFIFRTHQVVVPILPMKM